MVDPISLGALGAVALTQGIQFLYTQAGAILQRRRERRDAVAAGTAPPAEPIPVQDPSHVLNGQLAPLHIDEAAAEELANVVRDLRKELSDYAQGVEPESGDVDDAVRNTLALRDALESIVGQTITFRGEDRPATGTPVITGTVTAKEIRSRASGVEAGNVTEGVITGTVKADVITEGGDVAGVRVGDVGAKATRPHPHPRP